MTGSKYIFFDIDGTIYSYKNGIPDSTRDAVRMLRENGHHPVLCTGRTRIMVFDEILGLGFDGMIAGGGTYVEWQGNVIHYEELPVSEVVRIVECFRKNGFAAYPEGNAAFYYDPVYVDKSVDEIYRIYQRYIPGHIFPIDYQNIHCSKVSATYTERSNPKAVIDELGNDYYWIDHRGNLFETIPKNASKGVGVKRLAEYAGFDMDDCYGFGDSFNDLDMLKIVKYGVVMANGDEELKKIIPVHTEGMLDDGIYNALKRFGLI